MSYLTCRLNGSQRQSLKTLQSFIDLINQTVGDAISDLLMVEAMLTLRQWSLQQWSEMYTDLPNRQLKVKVKNRSAFVTADADRKLVEPAGLQQVVDTCVAKVEGGRSFVRPSGTEDVVRVYAEAKTRDTCDALAFEVAGEVYDRAGGVGERPKRP
jgi:phosphoacetylglucosamine mutase